MASTKAISEQTPEPITGQVSGQLLGPMATQAQVLKVVEMTKRFGRFVALDGVSMSLKPGTIHALLGENGAGKSTLVKCIMGFHQPTAGEVYIGEQAKVIKSPKDAHAYGIGMVYQHFTSVPSMSVAENLVLSRYNTPLFLDWKKELSALQTFIEQSPFQIDLQTPVAQLAAGQKQKLEILKQLYLKHRILILDEPTSVLTPAEAGEVLGLLRQEVLKGKLSILLITHKFKEVLSFADEVTILRKGERVGQGQVSELSVADMSRMMLGGAKTPQAVAEESPAKTSNSDRLSTHSTESTSAQSSIRVTPAIPPHSSAPNSSYDPSLNPKSADVPTLSFKGIKAHRDNGLVAVDGVSLTVDSGEVVGIAGVSGNGQKELVEVLSGQRSPTEGTIYVNGESYKATRAEMFRHQVYALPEEPLKNACAPGMSVAENISLRTFDQTPQARWQWWLVLKEIRNMAKGLVQAFSVKTPSVETPINNLSGGNIQRTVLARELSSASVQLLIAANPCFGLDFSAVEFIHNEIKAARDRGVAVLLVSEDLDELLELCDRILVISEGKFTYESAIATADLTVIGQRMAGH
ncbi:ABC transporter, ATP-binding protein [Synechococcus sp. PCC 7335]|uniref:ABC transporter ATP-binding protein n=1 Tax=Synechococcus sp. (strain ATCC 29403 / PCC 7335) TaxID=91464 RepID=UPI00017ECE8D|nr:ABC transporter ATP-binding protein [Synechococcus sp. PCC 7335]EDX85364.1 ABC transporter, ATP-binding protein [Synechococcus sp. PCC 7335]